MDTIAAYNEQTPYQNLTPDTILNAVEQAGFRCNGTLLALNSYENRVYQIGLEEAPPLVAKFYRSGRWSDAAIREEHQFCLALQEQELPVIAPLRDSQGETLFAHQGYRFALYPRQGGRPPELDNRDHLEQLGRLRPAPLSPPPDSLGCHLGRTCRATCPGQRTAPLRHAKKLSRDHQPTVDRFARLFSGGRGL
jgi:hypothetical protein